MIEQLFGKIPLGDSSVSEDLGGFREVIAPGAFDESLRRGDDVLARVEHDSRMLLGRRSSGTLRVRADRSALSYEVDVPATTTGRDLSIMIERADIKGSSFAFSLEGPEDEAESWSIEPDGTLLRRVLRAKLWDVSPVSQGAYPKASVTGRAEPQPAGVPLETLRLRNDLLAMD